MDNAQAGGMNQALIEAMVKDIVGAPGPMNALLEMQRNEIAKLRARCSSLRQMLKEAGEWYCGELPDGTDRRQAIVTLLAGL